MGRGPAPKNKTRKKIAAEKSEVALSNALSPASHAAMTEYHDAALSATEASNSETEVSIVEKKKKSKAKPVRPEVCRDDQTFEECELAVLRAAKDAARDLPITNKTLSSADVTRIISIVENFLVRKKLICYGGTAINNILPRHAQFYDHSVDIPDYDFYSTRPVEDAKELADTFLKAGYHEVEAKAGVHYGTYNVFVNFIKFADITFLHPQLFRNLFEESIVVARIHYASPNWLRMAMYLELCRPRGDLSRWEKVLTRITLLNKYFPLVPKGGEKKCLSRGVNFQRPMVEVAPDSQKAARVYEVVRSAFIQENVVFFGGYALQLFGTYMPDRQTRLIKKIADFDVLSVDAERTGSIVVEQLQAAGFQDAHLLHHPPLGEIIPKHVEVRVGKKDTVAFIYEPDECVNYNEVELEEKTAWMNRRSRAREKVHVRIATIDTILRYYMAFMYSGRPYFDTQRLLCASHFLFFVQQKNRLSQQGVLRRFTMTCLGTQKTMEEIRATKATMMRKFQAEKWRTRRKGRRRGARASKKEYERWFLRYIPTSSAKQRRMSKRRSRRSRKTKQQPSVYFYR